MTVRRTSAKNIEQVRDVERRLSLAGLPVIDIHEPLHRRLARKRKVVLPVLALLTVLGAIAARPGETPSVPIPRQLIGRWSTTDSRYAERGFRITPTTLTLATADSGEVVYTMRALHVEPDGRHKRYSVEYLDGDVVQLFSFTYADGAIRFPNQSDLEWRLEWDPTPPTSAATQNDTLLEPVLLAPEFLSCIKSVTADSRPGEMVVSCMDSLPTSSGILRNPGGR